MSLVTLIRESIVFYLCCFALGIYFKQILRVVAINLNRMEIIRDKDFKTFIENVRKGYEWIYELHCMLQTEEEPTRNEWGSKQNKNGEEPKMKKHHLLYLDDGGKPVCSEFIFEELGIYPGLELEKRIFRRIFAKDTKSQSYLIKSGFKNGYGFYSLAQELLGFLNVFHKEIFIDQPLSKLSYWTEYDSKSYDTVLKNFLVNFSVSIIYLSYFNILMIITSLDNCKKEYKRGDRLMNINLQEDIDIKKLLHLVDLYDLMFYFDLYNSGQVNFKLEEGFCNLKDKLHLYCEVFHHIEGNLHGLLEQNVNPSYLQFILCKSLFYHV
jgi:hypothetical protein